MSTHPCVSIPRVYTPVLSYRIRCESACDTCDKSFKENITIFSQATRSRFKGVPVTPASIAYREIYGSMGATC